MHTKTHNGMAFIFKTLSSKDMWRILRFSVAISIALQIVILMWLYLYPPKVSTVSTIKHPPGTIFLSTVGRSTVIYDAHPVFSASGSVHSARDNPSWLMGRGLIQRALYAQDPTVLNNAPVYEQLVGFPFGHLVFVGVAPGTQILLADGPIKFENRFGLPARVRADKVQIDGPNNGIAWKTVNEPIGGSLIQINCFYSAINSAIYLFATALIMIGIVGVCRHVRFVKNLCIYCKYSLADISDGGRCPECGRVIFDEKKKNLLSTRPFAPAHGGKKTIWVKYTTGILGTLLIILLFTWAWSGWHTRTVLIGTEFVASVRQGELSLVWVSPELQTVFSGIKVDHLFKMQWSLPKCKISANKIKMIMTIPFWCIVLLDTNIILIIILLFRKNVSPISASKSKVL